MLKLEQSRISVWIFTFIGDRFVELEEKWKLFAYFKIPLLMPNTISCTPFCNSEITEVYCPNYVDLWLLDRERYKIQGHDRNETKKSDQHLCSRVGYTASTLTCLQLIVAAAATI